MRNSFTLFALNSRVISSVLKVDYKVICVVICSLWGNDGNKISLTLSKNNSSHPKGLNVENMFY